MNSGLDESARARTREKKDRVARAIELTKAGWRTEEICAELDISKNSLSRYIRGHATPIERIEADAIYARKVRIILDLLAKYEPYTIAYEMGMNTSEVVAIARRHGVEVRPGTKVAKQRLGYYETGQALFEGVPLWK